MKASSVRATALAVLVAAYSAYADGRIKIVPAPQVKWEQCNPARGHKSPQAGTHWGDRKGALPTGFFAKFVDGFASPPDLRNATYRADVICGLDHNDDPDAAEM